MPFCSILECKNKSWGNNLPKHAVTFHRFPKDPDIKLKWIEATGKQNWFPAKTSTICSIHFDDKYIISKKSGYRYLTDDAVPEKNIIYFKAALVDRPGPSSEPLYIITPKHKFDVEATTEACSPKRVSACDSSASSESPPQKNILPSMVRHQEIIIKNQNLKIRRLQARNLRLKKKIIKTEDVLKTLRVKYSMDTDNFTALQNTNVKVDDLVTYRYILREDMGFRRKKEQFVAPATPIVQVWCDYD